MTASINADARSAPQINQDLIDRIINDRFGPELSGHGMSAEREEGYRAGWNACSRHIEGVLRIFVGLEEVIENAIDLRLKKLMTEAA